MSGVDRIDKGSVDLYGQTAAEPSVEAAGTGPDAPATSATPAVVAPPPARFGTPTAPELSSAHLVLQQPKRNAMDRGYDPGAGDLVVNLAASFGVGVASQPAYNLITGATHSYSLKNVASNWKGALDTTWAPDARRWVHVGVGSQAYANMRNQGFSMAESTLGALALGVGIEAGQSLEPNHPIDPKDIMWTAVGGAVVGEARIYAFKKAKERYYETGHAGWNALATAVNAGYARLGADKVELGFTWKW